MTFFTVVKQWNSLLREVVESPFLEILKAQLDMAWGNCINQTPF